MLQIESCSIPPPLSTLHFFSKIVSFLLALPCFYCVSAIFLAFLSDISKLLPFYRQNTVVHR